MDRSPATNDSILPGLRAATGEMHRALEDTVDIRECIKDLSRYTRLLEKFLGFYRPLESRLAKLADWPALGLDFAGRRKAPWLVTDLCALGFDAQAIDLLPDAPELPAASDPGSALGCLYVLEGATLGGRQISGLLDRSSVPVGARTFFGSYGADTGARWQQFVAILEGSAASSTDGARNGMIDSALATFHCLQQWMGQRTRGR